MRHAQPSSGKISNIKKSKLIYEKAIKMDQMFGYDIITNWKRNFIDINNNKLIINFPNDLINILIKYWYIPRKDNGSSNTLKVRTILNYQQLLNKYFPNIASITNINNNNQLIIPSLIRDKDSLWHLFRVLNNRSNRIMYLLKMEKPGKYDRDMIYNPKIVQLENYGIIINQWEIERLFKIQKKISMLIKIMI